jgi:chromosome segregation ATPase
VTDETATTRDSLSLEDVAHAALELASQRELDHLASSFLERVRAWASPSAVLAAVRDPASGSGWRLLSLLSTGSGPLGADRALRQLVDEVPQGVARPTLVRPAGGEVPGVRVRDNCIVPWSCEGESGILVLRGVPRPSPPNLPEAVAVLAMPVWPRLLGGPAARVEASLAELGRLAERLQADAGRQLERLKAARLPAEAEPPAEAPGDAARLADLEQQLDLARQEAKGAVLAREELRKRVATLEAALRQAEGERERSRSELERLSARISSRPPEGTVSREQLEGARREAEEARRAAENAQAAVRVAEEALTGARRELGESHQEARRATLELEDVKERMAALESSLREAEGQRDRARSEVERLSAVASSKLADEESATARLEKLRRESEEALAIARRDVESVREEARRGILEREKLEERLSAVEESRVEAEGERDRLRGEVDRLTSRLEAARSDLAAATERLEEARRLREAERASARTAAEAGRADERGAEGETARAPRPPSGGEVPRRDDVVAAFRSALTVLKRTPFVPPALRVSIEEAERHVEPKAESTAPWLRVVLLDRDAATLEPLAAELEEAGLEVKLANYPEELALLMKTPDARDLQAAVCDVLAFRPDQNVAGLFRSWQKDRPSLALYLSFSVDNAAEAERAQRVPNSLTAGRFRRPLLKEEVVEMLTPLARRPSS